MPPSPLEDRIVVLQRPKTLALRLNQNLTGDKNILPGVKSPYNTRQKTNSLKEQSNLGTTEPKTVRQQKHTDVQISLESRQGKSSQQKCSVYSDLIQNDKQSAKHTSQVGPKFKAVPVVARVTKDNSFKENSRPSQTVVVTTSQFSSPELSCSSDSMHPLKCGCRGCWKFMRCEEASSSGCLTCKSSLKSASCFSCKSAIKKLSCVTCSPTMKKVGCLPCGPTLKSLSCLTCNPSVKSLSSSCSFCSSDPIVTYDPHGSKSSCNDDDDDDYSVRTIWPEELAKKITKSKVHQQTPMILDCRNLMEYTKSQIQGAMHFTCSDSTGRRRLHQGKLAVLDFISSKEGRDSLKRLWPKDQTGPLNSNPSKEPSKTLPTQNLNLVLDSLNKNSEDLFTEKGTAPEKEGVPGDLPLLESKIGLSAGTPVALTPDLENAELSIILPFLFLGSEKDAQDLEKMRNLNIAYVVNVTTHLPLYHAETGLIRYKRLPATDNSKQNLRQYFEEAFEFIEEAHQCSKGVLVHCQAGVSRSATIVVAYLMKHTLMTMADAYKYVKGKRPIISPNLNFMGQLQEFENDLNAGITPRILTPKLTGVETEV
ncbi:dual specificity protein phosphatase 10-like [Protopterus annectens]|uniref:dual specificity protein phosphatase 10-like n=1 Tax=Protopterus annectens TaxID=7888 RepID=UPI001CFB7EBC|nr:dual specificity protein phosphatase 10-like [Protopterus annectens]